MAMVSGGCPLASSAVDEAASSDSHREDWNTCSGWSKTCSVNIARFVFWLSRVTCISCILYMQIKSQEKGCMTSPLLRPALKGNSKKTNYHQPEI